MMNEVYIFVFTLLFVFFATVMLSKLFIPVLMSKKLGQRILEIGPRWHKKKEGTPTMGGIFFIVPIVMSFIICSVIFFDSVDRTNWTILLNIIMFAIINAVIGLADDTAKISKKENKGLSAPVKFLLQSVAAIVFLISMKYVSGVSTEIYIPIIDVYWELGWIYYIVCFLLLCGFVNAVNLTDGIDGLAGSVTLTVGIFATLCGLVLLKDTAIGFIGGALIGASAGFLVYNIHPAKVFMGDTGSLFLGGAVVGLSFLLGNPLIVLLYGFVFLAEAVSVILQVIYFKLTGGKRLFLMAPLHHHFEKRGMSEIKIMTVFSLVNLIFCFLAILGLDFI